MKRKILLVPHGGLANRINALLSIVRFCEQYEIDLEVVWFRNKWLNASFFELFEPLNSRMKIRNHTWADSLLLDHGRKGNLFIPVRWQNLYYDKVLHWQESKAFMEGTAEQLKSYLEDASNIYINTCYALCPKASVNQVLRLDKCLLKRVKAIVATAFNDHMIGVHIRRTDLGLAIEHSPVEAFVERMKQEVSEDPETRFFVASDDDKVKRYLRKEFSADQLVILDHSADRNSSEGIKNGLIDMYLLSSTQRILGSYGSSFSLMAAEIGEIPHEIVLK